MNLHTFEQQLKRINPEFRIRQRGFNGIGGVFLRNEFLVTISHGDIPLNTYSYIYKQADRYKEKVRKRGRAQVARILNQRGLISRDDSVRLKYARVYSPEVRGVEI